MARASRPQLYWAGRKKSVTLTKTALWPDPCLLLAGPAELTPRPPPRTPQKPERQTARLQQPENTPLLELISLLIQLAQLSVFNYLGPAAPSLPNPPQGPAESEFPGPAGLMPGLNFPLPSSQPAAEFPGAEAGASAPQQASAEHWLGWLTAIGCL